MNFGPIQLIAFVFDSVDKFEGQIRRELDELRGRGLIRVLDLLFIMKEADGTVRSLQASDLLDHEVAEFGALLRRMLNLGAADDESAYLGELLGAVMPSEPGQGMSLADIQAAAAGVPAGKAAALLLFEHTWAIGLGEAILSAEGRMVAQGFVTRDALLTVGRELSTIVEAEGAIARAAAIRGAALLDALTTVVAAEELKQAPGDEAVRTMAAAEALRALVVAGLLDETAAPDAIDVLVRAGLISAPALHEAGRAADAAAADLADS
ncbi:MAG: hypothetical protein HGA45_43135 [Chloroflexales bacterium]|nr:hypothetical protein [Chloroflexales bacterium]